MENWKNYNIKLINKSIKLLNENINSEFNSEEERCYPHIRDLVAITIANMNLDTVRILDYGSNLMPWSNIQNKINIKKITVKIFDPYAEEDYSKNINFGFPISLENKLDNLIKYDYDLIIFGSSSQYINNFYEKLIAKVIKLPKTVFFLDTPYSLSNDFQFKQIDQLKREHTVYIRSFSKLISIMDQKGYELKFKSALPWGTQEFLDKKLSSEIKMLNLLFEG